MTTKFSYCSNRRGFSLLEMLIYISILTLMLVTTVNVLFSFSDSYHYFVLDRRVNSTAAAILERVVREVRSSVSIDIGASTFDVHPGMLTLNALDQTGDPVVRAFSLQGGVLTLSENGIVLGPLSSESVEITRLLFTRVASGIAEGVRIELTVRASRNTTKREATFLTFVMSRGSLE